ncbi:MAG: methyltransferase [Myxococcota bacterium]|nr:methyltransferase [Myxococcota bacterium]
MKIENAIGVCPVREDTEMLAVAAAEESPRRALDLGTGTGYVAIYLARAGASVDACDISDRALALARRNVARNDVAVTVLRSDLFEATRGVYDVIASNPPVDPRETELSRLATSTLRRSARVLNAILRVTQPRLEAGRQSFLRALATGALARLAPGGRIVLVLARRETDWVGSEVPGLVLVERRPVPSIHGYEIAIFHRA